MVLTRTDKPAGRGQQLTASPVKQLAQNHGIAVLQPRTLKPGLRDEAHVQALKDTGAQAMISSLVMKGLSLQQGVTTCSMVARAMTCSLAVAVMTR